MTWLKRGEWHIILYEYVFGNIRQFYQNTQGKDSYRNKNRERIVRRTWALLFFARELRVFFRENSFLHDKIFKLFYVQSMNLFGTCFRPRKICGVWFRLVYCGSMTLWRYNAHSTALLTAVHRCTLCYEKLVPLDCTSLTLDDEQTKIRKKTTENHTKRPVVWAANTDYTVHTHVTGLRICLSILLSNHNEKCTVKFKLHRCFHHFMYLRCALCVVSNVKADHVFL